MKAKKRKPIEFGMQRTGKVRFGKGQRIRMIRACQTNFYLYSMINKWHCTAEGIVCNGLNKNRF